jgi:zinc and cadmium transporter
MILLPLAAGNFLYIAGSDLIPELHKETRIKNAAIQLLMMMVGIGLMYGLSSNQHGHAEERGHHEEEIHEEHHE